MLYDILDGQTLKDDGSSYQIFTPYFKNCIKKLKVREPDPYNKFNFIVPKGIKQNEYYYDFKNSKEFYVPNENISVVGGRKNALKILKNIDKFKNYDKCRNILKYRTSMLSAYNHFSTVSIREVYWAIASVLGKKSGLITELHWRQFYYEMGYRFPISLRGQISDKKNLAVIPEYNKIKWSYSEEKFIRWCQGNTGIPVVDACMRQLNISGYMVNRGRMIVASMGLKNLHLDWRDCERYFATKLVDYDAIVNNESWIWILGGSRWSQEWFRVFNPWTQAQKFDPNCEYIKHWLPELKDVPNEDILKWYETYPKYEGIYPKPIVSHEETRKETIKMYKKALKN
jgi:deoxyribodipyrimidine photo-lyase